MVCVQRRRAPHHYISDVAALIQKHYAGAMHILWVVTKLFFFLSLVPALGVLVGFPLSLLSERMKILAAHQLVTERDGLVWR
jgi:hypothetical protein